jgi:hypothetical protein
MHESLGFGVRAVLALISGNSCGSKPVGPAGPTLMQICLVRVCRDVRRQAGLTECAPFAGRTQTECASKGTSFREGPVLAQVGGNIPRAKPIPDPRPAFARIYSFRLDRRIAWLFADRAKANPSFRVFSPSVRANAQWEQDGVQYIAVASGYGGVYSLFSGDARLASVPAGGSLWVFALTPQ